MANAKHENADQWMREVMNPKTLACIQEIQETQQALLALGIVSAALTKYGEQGLTRRDKLGEMDNIISARFRASCQHNIRPRLSPINKTVKLQPNKENEVTPAIFATPMKNALTMGAWAGPLPESILQSTLWYQS